MTARPLITNEALPIGTRLGGCTIDGVLAEDDFGFVYRITDSLLLGRVAIKEFFPGALCQRMGHDMQPRSDADAARVSAGWHAFVEEGRLLNRLQHPSLVRVLDSFEANGTVYQVMPLVAGPSLADWRGAQANPPDAGWLRELLLGLLDPLEALHGQGLLHGDLHPGKVMLPEGGAPVLLGFGTVRRALGLPPDASYAPIEQLAVGSHLPRGAWTDLYALGAVTWYAACGRAPVRSSERRVGAPFDPASTLAAALASSEGAPRDRAQLAAAVARAMALLPADRLQSAAELRAVFTASGPPPVVTPAPVEEPEPEEHFANTEPVEEDDEPRLHSGAPALADRTVFLVGSPFAEEDRPEPEPAQPHLPERAEPHLSPPEPVVQPSAAAVRPSPPAREPAAPAGRPEQPAREPVAAFSALDDEPTVVRPRPLFEPRAALPAFSATEEHPMAAAPQRRAAAPRRSTGSLMAWALVLLAGAAAGFAVWRWNDIVTTGKALVLPSVPAGMTMRPTEVAPVVPGAEAPTGAGPRTATAAQGAAPAAVTAPATAAPVAAAPAPATVAVQEPDSAKPVAGSGTASAAGEGSDPEAAVAAVAPREEIVDVKPAARRPAPAPRPPARAPVAAAEAPRSAPSPRAACGARANFSLHYCMQAQCRKPQYTAHPQCRELARTGEVS